MDREYRPLLYPLESIENMRDLGGRPAADGSRIKKGLLFRSAELSRCSKEDLSLLEDLGVGLVIDLRDLDEREARPDRLPEGARYRHLPVLPLGWARVEVPDSPLLPQLWRSDVHRFFMAFYRILAVSEETAARYAEFFRLLRESPLKPALWHCTQGKDRAGIAAILLQTALGVSWDSCIEDYLLTNQMVRPRLDAELSLCYDEREAERLCQMNLTHRDCIEAWRQEIVRKWGGLDEYLSGALGVDETARQELRRLYLE